MNAPPSSVAIYVDEPGTSARPSREPSQAPDTERTVMRSRDYLYAAVTGSSRPPSRSYEPQGQKDLPESLPRADGRAHSNPTYTLVNSGSVARDHLASERTFLAYVRTSLAIASMGVALVQLFRLSSHSGQSEVRNFAKPLGAVLITTGLVTLGIGSSRYFVIQKALMQGKFPLARLLIWAIAGILGVSILVIFGIMVGVASATQ